ncbi:MAG TPA: MoaD/ThiS family protein [archaeon]|nr:MoaD/ThiS family protein [archaeon]
MVRVLLFASLRQATGKNSILLQTDPHAGLSVTDIIRRLGLEGERVVVAINGVVCDRETMARGEDEVALMPVFSGG